MPRKVVTYDEFTKGEFGSFGNWSVGKGWFTGNNVVRYLSGALGPRSEPKAMTVTGLPNGAVLGIGSGVNGSAQPIVWFIVGNTVYHFVANATGSQAVTTYAGTLAGTPTYFTQGVATDDTVTHIAVYGDKVYKLDHSAATVTAIAAGPGGYVIAQYGERTCVANTGANGNRLYYSAASDPTSWPAANYIDVGDKARIKALIPQRGNLTIAKMGASVGGSAPANTTWWVLSGVPGVNDQLRKTLDHVVAGRFSHACVLGNGTVGFVASGAKVPSLYTGASVGMQRHLELPGSSSYSSDTNPPQFWALRLRDDNDWAIFCDPNVDRNRTVYLFREGCWTKHQFSTIAANAIVAGLPQLDLAIIAKNGSGGAAPAFYQWQAYIDRPPASTESYVTTPSVDCNFTLPEYRAPDDVEFQITGVIVYFDKYNQGFGGNNTFTVTATPISRSGGDGNARSETWTESAASSSSSGTRDVETLTFANSVDLGEFGAGFRIRVSGIVGVAISRIDVLLDTTAITATDE